MSKEAAIDTIISKLNIENPTLVEGLTKLSASNAEALAKAVISSTKGKSPTVDAVLAAITERRTAYPTVPLLSVEVAPELGMTVFQFNGAVSILRDRGEVISGKQFRLGGKHVLFLAGENAEKVFADMKAKRTADRKAKLDAQKAETAKRREEEKAAKAKARAEAKAKADAEKKAKAKKAPAKKAPAKKKKK